MTLHSHSHLPALHCHLVVVHMGRPAEASKPLWLRVEHKGWAETHSRSRGGLVDQLEPLAAHTELDHTRAKARILRLAVVGRRSSTDSKLLAAEGIRRVEHLNSPDSVKGNMAVAGQGTDLGHARRTIQAHALPRSLFLY